MERIRYIHSWQTDPYRNLALEACLLGQVQPGECILYLWQNRRTVVIGKNQNAWRECRVGALEQDGGFLARRLSGGGAVYHDLGNLNFTFLAQERDYDVGRQLQVILEAVRYFGIHTEKTGRNDVTACGRKFSGNAFYRSGNRCYHHGTILINADTEDMTKYLNVSTEKLQSKGVGSVKSRVVNLAELCPGLTAGRMRDALLTSFCAVYGLVPEEVPDEELDREELERQTGHFSSWEWRLGQTIPFTNEWSGRFPWGGICIQFAVRGGKVEKAGVYSDALDVDYIGALPAALEGCIYAPDALTQALEGLPCRDGQMAADIKSLLAEQG